MRVRFAHADLEALQINLPQRPFGDARIVVVAVEFLVVARKMLGAGGDARALNALHRRRGDLARKDGVFRIVLEVAPAEGAPLDVHPGGEQHVAAALSHLLPHARIHFGNERLVEGAGEQRADGDERACALQADARRPVRRDDGRHPFPVEGGQYAAERPRIALGTQGAVHLVVAAGDGFELVKGELRNKGAEGHFSRSHILEGAGLRVHFPQALGRDGSRHLRLDVRSCEPHGNLDERIFPALVFRTEDGEGHTRSAALCKVP